MQENRNTTFQKDFRWHIVYFVGKIAKYYDIHCVQKCISLSRIALNSPYKRVGTRYVFGKSKRLSLTDIPQDSIYLPVNGINVVSSGQLKVFQTKVLLKANFPHYDTYIHNWPLQPFSQDFGLASHHSCCVR